MRILIVTAWYHPFIQPRAHRWTALAEHWAAAGHRVYVVTGRHRGYEKYAVINGVHVHRAGFDSLKEVFYYYFSGKNARYRPGGAVEPPGLLSRLLFFLYKKIWKNICFPDDAGLWYFPALRRAGKIVREFDVQALVSVSFPFTGHLVGRTLKKRYPHLPWVADTGDPFTIHDVPLYNTFLYGTINRRLEKSILQQADYYTVTTSALKKKYGQVFGETFCRKIEVVPPLCHPFAFPAPGDYPEEWSIEKRAGEIRLGYFGAFLSRIRTPFALLNMLGDLKRQRPDIFPRLRLHILGEILPEFLPAFQKHPEVKLYGLCSREQARAVMTQMDALIHVGNRTDYQLPSKAADYLASDRPVIHLSYLDEDPFVDFWGDAPGLMCARVRDEHVEGWENLPWESLVGGGSDRVTQSHPVTFAKLRRQKAEACSVQAIGEKIWSLLATTADASRNG